MDILTQDLLIKPSILIVLVDTASISNFHLRSRVIITRRPFEHPFLLGCSLNDSACLNRFNVPRDCEKAAFVLVKRILAFKFLSK